MTAETRDQPLIAIDVVPITFSSVDGLLVGTAERLSEPFSGAQALPGVLLGSAEPLAAAAMRALESKAGFKAGDIRHLSQVGAFDRPGRDPRSHAISIGFVAVVGPGAGVGATTEWVNIESRGRGLPFDHDDIIDVALERVRTSLWGDVPLTRALLGPRFSTVSAALLQEFLTGLKPHPANFHRDLAKNAALSRLEFAAETDRGRPATMWEWRVQD